jgi:hypothetical protein
MSKGKRRLLVLALALTLVTSQLLPVGMFTLIAAAEDGIEVEEAKNDPVLTETESESEDKEITAEEKPDAEKITAAEDEILEEEKAAIPDESSEAVMALEQAGTEEVKTPALKVSSLDIIFSSDEMLKKLAFKSESLVYDGKDHKLLPEFENAESDGRVLLTDKNGHKWYGTFHVGAGYQRGLTEKNVGDYSWGIAVYLDKLESTSGSVVYNKGSLYGNYFSVRFERPTYGWYEYYPGNVSDNEGQIAAFPKLNLSITPRAITVKLNNVSKVYGQKDPDKATWATLVSGSLGEGDDIGSLLKLQRAKGEDVGEYPFTVGGSSSSGSGNSEVVKAPAAKSAVKEEKAKISDVAAATEKEKEVSAEQKPTTETKASRIGNYSVAFENNKGMLTITPAPVVITAVDNGKLYGTADPVLTYTVAGLLNGEKLPAGFVFNHRRAAGEAIGRYPINLEIDPKVADASNNSEKPDEPIDVVAPSYPWADKEEVKEAVEAREAERADVEEREKVRVIVDKIPGEARPEQPGEVERPDWPNWPGIDPEPDPGQDPVITDDTNGFKAMNYEFRIVPGVFTITGTSAGTTTTPNNNGGGNNGGNGGNPAAGGDDFTVADAAVPAAAPAAPATTIADPATPLSSGNGNGIGGAWALVNLICSILTVLGSLIAVFRRKDDEEEDEEQNVNMYRDEEDEDNRGRKMFAAKAAGILTAIASVITFILTEDMRLPMILIDKWTLLMVIMLAVQIVAAVLNKKASEADEEEDDAEATMA